MTTQVAATYTPSLNLSITTRDGVVSRITTWTTGNSAKQTDRTLFAGDPDLSK